MGSLGIAIVGLGQRSFKKVIDVVEVNTCAWNITAAVDSDPSARSRFRSRNEKAALFNSVHDTPRWNASLPHHPIKAVYIAVPHHCYPQIVHTLLKAGLHVLKEKPAAFFLEELSIN